MRGPRIIRTTSDTPQPTRFRVWDKITSEEQLALLQEMKKRGNKNWNPGGVIEVESSKEIVHIMKEPPVGEQAIIGRTPVTIKRRKRKKGSAVGNNNIVRTKP